MDRGYRRYTERRAFVRRLNIAADHYGWDWLVDPSYSSRRGITLGTHQHRQARIAPWMSEPGYWVHEQMTVPARRKETAMLRRVIGGTDPDGMVWPDNRKPHKYYW